MQSKRTATTSSMSGVSESKEFRSSTLSSKGDLGLVSGPEVVSTFPLSSQLGQSLFEDKLGSSGRMAASTTSSSCTLDASLENFDSLSADLRKLVQVWVQNTQSSLRAMVCDVEDSRTRLEEEKARHLREIEETKSLEYKRIREARTRMENEMASLARQIAAERELCKQRINDERAKLEAEKARTRNKLKLETERLRRETDAFETERRRIVDLNIATQTMVELNVGGVLFETARATLTKYPDSYLGALFSGRHEIARDKGGRVFIDRDAGHFRTILNFLRDPSAMPVSKDLAESCSLFQEAEHYGIKFSAFPFVFGIGGHNGNMYLNSVEVLDMAEKSWREVTPMETARAYFAAGNLYNQIYVAGGQNLEYKALCDVECYDAMRDVWSAAPALKVPRKSTAGAISGCRFFVIGGFDGAEILTSVEMLDPRMKNWIDIAPLKTGRSAGMACAHGDKVFVFGGSCGERLNTGEVYDTRMNKWQELPNGMAMAKSGGSAVSLLGSIFAIGGIDPNQKVLDAVEVYDQAAGEWGFRHNIPVPIVDGSCWNLADSIIVAGGQAYGSVYKDSYVYQCLLDQWQLGPPMLQARLGLELCGVHV